MDLKQLKKNRFLFLQHIYQQGNGDPAAVFAMEEIGADLSMDYDLVQQITTYLVNENLLEYYGLGGNIHITHNGIKEVEQALEQPDKPTEHFYPLNIISIGSMTNSTLQQNTSGSSINLTISGTQSTELKKIIDELEKIQDSLSISSELQNELVSELQTLQIQSKSPKPKSVIVVESMKTIRSLLENVVGNAITPFIINSISQFLNNF